MRLGVPVFGIFVAAGSCCCCCGGDFFERVQAELEQRGVKMPDAPEVPLPGENASAPEGMRDAGEGARSDDAIEPRGGGKADTKTGSLPGPLAGFPTYEGATLQASAEMAGITSANYYIQGSARPSQVVDFYANYAKSNGWAEVARTNAAETSLFQGTKDRKTLTVSATTQGLQVWLTLAVSPPM